MGAGLAMVAIVFGATVFGLPLFFFGLMAALDRFERSLSAPQSAAPAAAAPAEAPVPAAVAATPVPSTSPAQLDTQVLLPAAAPTAAAV
jgi:hypothetical protein